MGHQKGAKTIYKEMWPHQKNIPNPRKIRAERIDLVSKVDAIGLVIWKKYKINPIKMSGLEKNLMEEFPSRRNVRSAMVAIKNR